MGKFKVSYNRGDEIIEFIIRDESGTKIDTRRCNMSDKRESGKILKYLKSKYGFNPMIQDKQLLDLDSDFWSY